MTMPTVLSNVDQYVDEMLAKRGFDRAKIEEAVYEELRSDVRERLQSAINAELIATLTPEDLAELEQLLDTAGTSDDQVRKFFQTKIGDLDDRMARVIIDFQNAYLA